MEVAVTHLVGARWLFVLLLSAAAAGCSAPVVGDGSDDDAPSEGGNLETAWWSTKTCGVGPYDDATAKALNGSLANTLKGHLNAEKIACARIIVGTALTRGLGERGAQIAIATSIVETTLENIDVAVDHDSLGLFQQRPSAGWGTKAQLVDPQYATNAFLDRMIKTYGDSWRTRSLGEVAQGVQRSAYPSRYGVQEADALVIARGLAGSVCPGAKGITVGEIDRKFQALGGCGSFLGAPITNERGTPKPGGRYNHFEHGSIYWTPGTGAHEVHGPIRDAWQALGWEAGVLGYPTSDEAPTDGNTGSFSAFQNGVVYMSPGTGAHAVRGKILAKWKELGLEKSALGYPTGDEQDDAGSQRSDFEHGSIRVVGEEAIVEMR